MSAIPPWLSLGPVSLERPASAAWTAVGVLDPSAVARIDAAGLVNPVPGGWSLDWWVGAEDRWHLPSREPAVRQRRVGTGPVLETAVRIPSGDAVQRVWATRAGGGEVLVVEVENASPTPVALALAVRPYDVDGQPAAITSLDVAGDAVVVDGRPALWLPRPANESAATAGGDLVDTVQAGRALRWDGPVADDGGRVTGVVVYPLPHRARVRVLLPLSTAAPSAPVAPASVPDHEAVARGWDAVLDSGARVALPDPALTEAAGRCRARVLLAAPPLPAELAALEAGAGIRVAALAAGGHDTEALRPVSALVDALWDRPGAAPPVEATAEAVGAAALAGGLADDRRVERELTEALVALTSSIDRRRSRQAARPAVAALAAHSGRVGQDQAARSLARRAGGLGADPWAWARDPGGVPDGPAGAEELVASVSATGPSAGDDPTRAAVAWLALRRLLVVEGDGTLDVLSTFPSRWRGGTAEVHRLPTLFGRLSFAIRWHGYRPALLWELERRPGDPTAVLRCPGLDPGWSSTEARGEALLAGSASGLAAAPAEGDSFT